MEVNYEYTTILIHFWSLFKLAFNVDLVLKGFYEQF